MTMQNAPSTAVAQAFAAMSEESATVLMAVRDMICEQAWDVAAGRLTETLKWGQPSYLTEQTKSGTTIRLGLQGGRPALFVHCQTTIIEEARERFGDMLEFAGSRAVILPGDPTASEALRHFITMALTYHARKRTASKTGVKAAAARQP